MMRVLIALFAVYVLATLWQGRRTVAATEPAARLGEARRLLILVSLGVPLAVAFILAA
ncbi:MAG: hypothetical protein O3B31_07080 [Chloroflexi bacterium]|nr:hypothetical protein [Chloroflexota bacterium]